MSLDQLWVATGELCPKFNILDALWPHEVVARDVTQPPKSHEGQVYIVAPEARGAWQGQDDNLACAINGAWEFVSPQKDWQFFVSREQKEVRFDGTAWKKSY